MYATASREGGSEREREGEREEGRGEREGGERGRGERRHEKIWV